MSKLFLDDGANYMHARCEPEYIYYPDESTINEIKYLFVTLKSTELGGLKSNESVIFIKNMPFSYDLAMLSSEGDGNVLSLEDIISSMCRLGTHFISGHDLIQTRANAYIRCKLAGAESVVHGLVVSQSEQSVERDQILLSSATVPSSPRDVNTNHSDCYENGIPNMNRNASSEAFQKVSRASCATPPSTELMLFRSPSVRNEEMNTFPVSVFTMDDESVSAVLNFLPKLEGEMAFISRKAMSSCKSDQLHELWEYFDFDDDGIVTRDDFLLGVSNLAKNYIATDHFTQLLANSYIQRKVRRALFSIGKHQRSLEYDRRESATKKASSFIEDLKNTKYSPGSTVVYTDEEGNNHITKVIRLSNRPMDGQDAYYIETKGVKLYVAASRIRLLNAQDVSALDRADSFQAQQGREIIPSKITEPSTSTEKSSVNAVTSSHTISQEAEIAPIGHSLYTSDSVESLCVRGRNAMDEDITPAIASTPSKGILGYLKSSILGIGGTKASSVVPHANPDTTGNAQCLLSSNLTINEILSLNGTGDVNDADSVVTSGSLLQQTNQGSPLLISPDSVAQSVNIPHSPNGSSGCDTAADSHNANQPTVKPEQGALSVDQCVEDSHGDNQEASVSVASAQTLTTSQRLHTTAAILRADAEVLNVVAKATTTSYKLTRSMYPKPKKVEPYPIYFNRGKNGFFEFNQVDFGVQFSPFMREVIPTQDSRWQSSSESLSETNRCFFLHFGVAMGLHPFALQQCFRSAAAELLKYPENEMTIFFGESLESLLLRNDFVDAQVLTAIWPLEFDRYKILIVRVDHNGRIESFTSFRSELGPLDEFGEWAGEELIFTLQWNHFTILKPKSEQLNKPITAVLAAASMIGIMPLEFITKVDSDPANRFRICR